MAHLVSVRNLAPGISAEKLRSAFKKFGKVASVNVNDDGTGSIMYEKANSASSATQSMNRSVVFGKRLQVTTGEFKEAAAPAGAAPVAERRAFLGRGDKLIAYKKSRTLCATVSLGGVCTHGDDCLFSHDPENALTKSDNLCRNFAKTGKCPHGDRCLFSHDPTIDKRSIYKCRNVEKYGECTRPDCAYKHPHKRTTDAPEPPAAKKLKIASVPKSQRAPMPTTTTTTTPAPTSAASSKAPMCAECITAPATLLCAQCEEHYCTTCDATAHASRVMSKHTRTALAVPVVCAECRTSAASVRCTKCELDFCSGCSWKIHEFRVFRSHRREAIGTTSSSDESDQEEKQDVEKVEEAKDVAMEDESEEEEAAPVQATLVPKKPIIRPMPKMVLSDESSSEEEDDVAAVKTPVAAVKTPVAAVKTPVAAVKTPVAAVKKPVVTELSSEDESEDEVAPAQAAPATTLNSESSDDEEEEVVAPKKAFVPATFAAVAAATELSTESDSSDDEVTAAPKQALQKAVAAPAASLSSSDDESDDDDIKVVKKAPLASTTTHSVVKKIQNYAESDATDVLHLSPDLNSYERLLAHDTAEKLGLAHVSVGDGLDRHITVSKSAQVPKAKKAWSKSRA
ncbi:hypothetical protein SDRG_10295 [Saprolegnia diclina VS20]|uniref:Uncharacterized protein n=1 Tax=Saprolegnia diclina (strain VS20) TaxID=1156394 RepID=T0Q2N7_SAPDV|nr:hypothetical protein SDRG_10295 [Saprolegnia diclina VS20]EQC32099.1 hypothetical protein SDRG_10295 [Saprolegnia diclina VS20]|eukprot:XP_008614501.1 hypothetical protein SDRG_10295 [Saprolegnia diclina VS20]